MKRRVAGLIPGLLFATPLQAADQDGQVWTGASLSVDLSKQVVATLEAGVRFTDDASRTGQTFVRPSIGYRIGRNTTASLGYAYFHSDPVGPSQSKEHRLWEQISFRALGDGKGITITGRSRLEQRRVEGRDDTGWRYRQQIRVTAPLGTKVRGFYYSEGFVTLNTTEWGQRSGLDRVRNSVGLSIPITKAVTLEPGYLNQWILRGPDRVHHIANLVLSARI